MFRSVRLIVASSLSLAFVACGQSAPTGDAARSLHIFNRTTRALAVDIAGHGSDGTYDGAVRPCQELAVVAGQRGVPPTGDLVITLLADPTGNLDLVLSRSSGDPYEMTANFSGLSIVWGNGETRAEDLPRWIVVTPAYTSVLTSAPGSLPDCTNLDVPAAS